MTSTQVSRSASRPLDSPDRDSSDQDSADQQSHDLDSPDLARLYPAPLDPASDHRGQAVTLLEAAIHAVGSQATVAVAAAAAHASLAIAEEMRTANLIEAFRIPKVTDESSKATLQIVAARLALELD